MVLTAIKPRQKQQLQMKRINFTAGAGENQKACPVNGQSPNHLFDLSYFTLCRMADRIGYTYPTPKTMGLYCQQNGDQTMTLDDLGNFVSLKPTLPVS